jgi:hypothetical protein
MAPMNLGTVKVHFVHYETPAELSALLRRINSDPDVDPREASSTIVLAIPGKLRAFLGWATKGAPRPEIHGDVLVFQRPKP